MDVSGLEEDPRDSKRVFLLRIKWNALIGTEDNAGAEDVGEMNAYDWFELLFKRAVF